MERTPKKEIVDWIIKELDEIAPALPVYFDGNVKAHG